jgi:hypothetical protein
MENRHVLQSFEHLKKYVNLTLFERNWRTVEKVVEVRTFTVL